MALTPTTLPIKDGESDTEAFLAREDGSGNIVLDRVMVDADGTPIQLDADGRLPAKMIGAEGFPAQISAFGELHVAEEHTDIAIRFGKNQPSFSTKGRFVEEGSVTANVGYHTLDSTSGTAAVESVAKTQYRIGRPMVYRITTAETAGAGTVRVGAFDSEQGFFVLVNATNGTITSVNIRSGGVDTPTTTLNGDDLTGIDFSEGTIWQIRYGWLGFYPPSIWVVKGQSLVRVHTFPTDEGRTTPHIPHPSCPCRVQADGGAIVNVGSAVGGSIGGPENDRSKNPFSYSREVTNQTAATTLANFRMASTDSDGNKVRVKATLQKLSPYIQANTVGQSGAVDLVIYGGVTIGGTPSWAAVRSDGFIEVDTAGTFTSGTQLLRKTFGYSDTNQGGANFSAGDIDAVALGLVAWAGDVFTIRFEPAFGGTNAWDAKLTVEYTE